jgi:cobalt-zinc-cadmium efflux system protein
MGHDHDDHDHSGHSHSHAPVDFGRAFALGVGLNMSFVVVEVVYGVFGKSVALIADAGHNFGDALGLLVAWIASVLVRRAPSPRFSYGLRGSSILAALFNAIFLLLTVGAISWEAIQRLSQPAPVSGGTVMIVAAAGVAVNGVTAWLFAAGREGDLNLRGAFTHMLADALVSAGVVASGLVILLTGWLRVDPLVSLGVNAVIVWGTWGLLRDSLGMALAATPGHIDPALVRGFLERREGVASLHDLHIWPMSTTEVALTCHLVMPAGHPGDLFIHSLCEDLAHRFKIHHATIQIEVDPEIVCALAPDAVI